MKSFITYFLFCCLYYFNLSAQQHRSHALERNGFAELHKSSSLTISGSTNVIPFKLYQCGESLSKNKFFFETNNSENTTTLKQNQLSVELRSFESKNKMALKDFWKLLKSETYPCLNVQIIYMDFHPSMGVKQTYNGKAVLCITITGIKKYYSIPINFCSTEETYTINGKHKLNIKDFGLTPETKMMGMIKVNDWIDIDFNIVCKINNTELPSNLHILNNSNLKNF